MRDNRIRDLENALDGYITGKDELQKKFDQISAKITTTEAERDSYVSEIFT